MVEEITRPTVLEVNEKAFFNNIAKIKAYLRPDVTIMPVVKANAYGTYLNTRLEILNQFDIVAVAMADEGVAIRNIGYQKDIFILNQPDKYEIEKIVKNDLIIGLSSLEFAKRLGKIDKKIRVHIEIETGMGRTGVKALEAVKFVNSLPKNIKIEGIYTHLSSAESDFDFTNEQLIIFSDAVNKIKQIARLKYIHSHASNGILNFPNAWFNMARPGIIMYGYPSDFETCKNFDLEPVCKLKSRITFLKKVLAGTSISYNRAFIAAKNIKVATIPIGYADGLRRALSDKGEVVIKGKKAKIIGKICMDSFMVDVTDIEDVKVGDEVYIWDNKNITLEDIAKQCDTINYEILSCISERVPRIFVK